MDSKPLDIDWGQFFELYRPLALRVARGIVAQRDDEEEVVQEAARSVFERARAGELALESVAHARNYFLRAVRNLAVSGVRKGSRMTHDPDFEPADVPARASDGPQASLARAQAGQELSELQARFESALGGLKPLERVALALRYQDGLSYKQMAARTGTSISTLQARVEAALKKIRSRLGKPGGGA